MRVARRGRPHARTRLVAVICAALAVAACGAGGASLPPAPSGVPSLRDIVPEEVEGLPVDPGTKPMAKGWYRWGDPDPNMSSRIRTLAEGVETVWDPFIGIIILGPEETDGRISQLILQVGDGGSSGRLPITTATLSRSARSVGSLARGEADLHEGPVKSEFAAEVRIEERGPNYLKGTFSVAVRRAAVLVGGAELDDREATLQLGGEFVAVEP